MTEQPIAPPTSKDITIEGGSDAGKVFQIRMMSAYTGDRWARKLAAAVARGASRLPDSVMSGGPSAFAGISIAVFGQIEDDVREELFAELLNCVKIKRGNAHSASDVIEYDFTDPMTLTRTREEAFNVNVNFIKAAVSQLFPLAAVTSLLGEALSPVPAPNPPT